MRRLATVSILSLVLAAPVLAQTSSKGVVGVDPAGPAGPTPAGTTAEASVTMRIRSGYHTNAQKPTEDYLIGTNLKLTPPAGVTVAKLTYPGAQYHKFSFSEKPLAVYEGTVKIGVALKIDATVAPGPITVPGKLTFQACDDEQCLPPSTVDVSFAIDVAAAAAEAEEATQTLTVTGAPPEARVFVDGRQVGRANAQGRLVAREVKPGRRRVRVEQDGFQPFEQAVDVAADRPQTLAVALVADPTVQPAPVDAAPPAAAAPAAAPAPAPVPAAAEPSAGSNAPLWIAIVAGTLALLGLGIYAATRKRTLP
jgi:hypothetical protein